MNVVPNARTKLIARAMVQDASLEPGADVVLKHLHKVPADQLPALIGVLLTATKIHKKTGRPRLADRFTPEVRAEGVRRYKAGERDEWVVAAYREYIRHTTRAFRARHGRAKAS